MPQTDQEALERVRAWLARGNPSGGMNLPPDHAGKIPSIRQDLRTLLALASRSVLPGGEGNIGSSVDESADVEERGASVEEATLPCDIAINHITFRKGARLSTFVDAARRWHTTACAAPSSHPGEAVAPKELPPLSATDEQSNPNPLGGSEVEAVARAEQERCFEVDTPNLSDPGADSDLLARGDVLALLARLATSEADYALYGAPENARTREAAEAGLTRARCAVAMMPPSRRPAPLPEDVGELVGKLRDHGRFKYMSAVCRSAMDQAADRLESLAKQKAISDYNRDANAAALRLANAKLASAERERDETRALLSLRMGHSAARETILQERLERAEEALKPFAAHAGKSGEPVVLKIGDDTWTASLTTDHFKAARAYFHQAEKPQAGDGK